jgi:predicted RNA polymerase sigma factor
MESYGLAHLAELGGRTDAEAIETLFDVLRNEPSPVIARCAAAVLGSHAGTAARYAVLERLEIALLVRWENDVRHAIRQALRRLREG